MMKTTLKIFLTVALTLSPALAAEKGGDEIPAHPNQLVFKPLDYQPPQKADYARQLLHGVPAFMAEDHDLPLVQISILLRVGDYLDPAGKTGLAQAVGRLLRSGGTQSMTADDFDEEADFLAANIGSSITAVNGSASLNVLSKDLDRGLDLFFDMVQNPAFQQDRVDLLESQILQQMERRNDRTSSIESREWSRLTRGPDFFIAKEATKATVDAISREDMIEFHRHHYVPANFILAVSGDFQTEQMIDKLNARLSAWEGPGEVSAAIPKPDYQPVPGVYMVNKSEVNQGRVTMGHGGIGWGNPDEFAVELMNEILGGSGFTSRITNRVRSDEGLAYSAYSSFNPQAFFPGLFLVRFQSKSPTCAQAAQIAIEEIERLREEKVTQEELDTVRNGAIDAFPRRFSSARAVVATFANDELRGRDPEYWNNYRDRLRAVTVDDVQRVAREYLHPDKLLILAVGNVEDMLKGNPDKPEYSFEKLAGEAGITRIPLPDPLTLEYPR